MWRKIRNFSRLQGRLRAELASTQNTGVAISGVAGNLELTKILKDEVTNPLLSKANDGNKKQLKATFSTKIRVECLRFGLVLP